MKGLDQLTYDLGYWQGRIDEVRLYSPFTSLKFWHIFLVGIAWGLILALWILEIFT